MSQSTETMAGLSSEQKRQMLAEILRKRAGESRVFPLSFAQQRLWFLDRMEPGSSSYNVARAVRLEGELSAGVLERTLAEIVRRHASLRTTFTTVAGEPAQVVAPAADLRLPVVDVPGAAPEEREREALRLADEEARAPFDLGTGPLFRATLLRLSEREHVLVLVLHHVVTDGWSMGVLFRELAALYAAFVRGEPSPLPELPIQYPDFAVWQRKHLASERLETQLAYWRERLAGAPPVLELPTDRPRPAVQTQRGGEHRLALAAPVADALRDLARGEGTTLFVALLAALQALLAEYAGEDDVVVGIPVANRTRAELEGLIGFFVNALAIRTPLAGDPSFRELLGRVREGVLEAQAHQDLPFEKLVEELAPERSLSHHPLFQVMFALHNAPAADVALPGLTLRRVDTGAGEAAKFDLSVESYELADGLEVRFEYNADLFDASTVARMAEHFEGLLRQVADAPDARLSALSLLGAAERERVLREWNDTARPLPGACVHELFAEQAERTADAPAVVADDGVLTYDELHRRSNRLAHFLRGRGVGPESRVGICVDRSAEMVAAVLGVLKAGAAYVPIDPAYPADRQRFVLADAGIALLLTQEHLAATLPAGVETVRLDADRERIAREPESAPDVRVDADHLAYVIYTSGSTGTPKGVLVQHGGFANLLLASRDTFGLHDGDLAPVPASYAFDIWGFEALAPLVSGGAVRIVPRDDVVDVGRLVDRLADATLLHAVPALMRQVVSTVRASDGGTLPGMRCVFVGGDAVPPELLPEMREAFPGAEIRVLYGPTEATVLASSHRLDPAETVAGNVLGRPLANVRVYVLNRAGEAVPAGVPGELYIGGAGVARGYLGRPELTAEKFVPDPFGDGARLYRTGDRARWRADGTLEFLGRTDNQVKIRGFRIEPGEIEAVLAAAPGVREAAVVARGDAAFGVPGERRLVGYVVPEGAVPSVAELRAFLRDRLPEHMVPAALVVLDEFPLSPAGKVDRRALPAPDAAHMGAEYVAPRTPTEEILAEVWAEVLGAGRVGAHDNFFELGGHSLLATRVQSRIRSALGAEVPLRALFEAPTVAELAVLVDAARRGEQGTELPPLLRVPREGEIPPSFAQERLWVIDRLDPGSAVYNMPVALRLAGPLDAAVLRAALEALEERHESLRTVFPGIDGRPVQRILPAGSVALAFADLAALPAPERDAEALARVREEARFSFDVETGPLFRAALLRLSATEHVLVMNVHHIVSDGWSTGVLFQELGALYAAFADGRPSPLPGLPVQYADYAVWQRGWLQGERLERQLAYWRERLAGAPPELDLPTDRPRPAVWSPEGALHASELPAGLRAALHALARREGATLFMTVLAAFQTLLARYAGEEDVVVGTPVAGRTHEALEGVVGFFVNTLALRGDLGGDPTFRQLLARVRETTLGAYQHQDLPFEKLVEELAPERSLNRNPVFQVMFTLQNAGAPAPELPGVAASPLETGGYAAKFDLALGIVEEGDRLLAGLGYAASLFDAATVERMAGHLRTLLERIAARPEARLSELSLLDAAEERRLLAEWNDTARPLPERLRAHDLVAARAARDPGAPAVHFGAEVLTYGELDERSSRLARYLRGLGVGPETPVAICLDASPEVLVGVLAILKAGGAYVPLDPAYPQERLRLVLEDAAAPVLLTRSRLADRLPAHGARVVCLDSEWERIARESAEPVGGGALPESLAYMIYTSGSTGRPKGVRVEHRSLVNLLLAGRDAFAMEAGDVTPSLSSFAFDIWVFEALVPLASGGATRLVPRDRVAEVEWLVREIGDVTTLHTVPALMRQLVAAVRAAGPGALPRLRQAFVGGDAVPPDLLAEMREAFPAATVRVLYGPTEATVVCAAYPVPDQGAVARQMIGAPLANARLYVVDRSGSPVPTGVPGELCIGGAGVARDYLDRPDLTAEKFVPDAFAGDPGARLYRTGDRARWLADGTLEFLGRTDNQVKIRGFRIEPGEIEAVLAQAPGVVEAVVVARRDVPGELRLVGYVVAAGEERPSAAELRAFLKERLPEHMVPAALVVLDAFPLTPTGKIDRRALPAPEASPEGAEGFVSPRTPTEEVLAGIWAEVLGLARVGARDSFFELGGHSLLATRVASRVRSTLGVALPVRAVFEAPTVAELSERVDALRRAGVGIQLPPLAPRGPAEGDFPLSFAQERLWMLHQMDPESGAYNMPFFLRLEGSLDPDALRATLDSLAERHPALRTTFPSVGEKPVQRVAAPAPVPLPVVDLTGCPEAERHLRAHALAVEEARRPFDLAGGPLFRAALLRLAGDEHHLLLALHHIVGDGWSMGVVFRELGALYAAFHAGRPSPLAEPGVRYTDYSAWQREWLSGEVLERQAAWWREQLAGAPPVLELPTDRPRPPVQSNRGAGHRFALAPAVREGLHSLARREGATLFMTLLAAFQALLAKYSGQPDVVVGTPIAGRTHEALEDVVGFFVNTLALRGDLGGDPTFRQLLDRVRESTLGAYAHQDLPFEKLVEELAPERSLSHTPLFQVMFSVQTAGRDELRLPGLTASGLEAESGTTKFDLALGLGDDGEGLHGALGYSTDLFDAATIERMAGHFQVLLERIVAAPDARLSTLSLLDEAEAALVIGDWNRTERTYRSRPVHELFAEQAAATPDAVAVAFGEERLTYAELDARAGRLARRLRAAGVRPEVTVGVCVERGPEILAAILGVLKAGGAYVPLDPAYPPERLRFVLTDAAVALLVTQERLLPSLPEHAARVVLLDGPDPDPPVSRESDAGPENLAYVIYTSGSTGRPKGVRVEHRSLANTLLTARETFGFKGCDVAPVLASYAFDIWAFEALVPLLAGGMVRVLPRERIVDVERLAGELAGTSVLHAVPALMRQVAAALRGSGRTLPRMRRVFVGGDAVPPDLLPEMREVFPEAEIRVLYGPTEATIIGASHLVAPGAAVDRHLLGKPLGNVRLYVLGAAGEPVPLGVAGELCIGGAGVARDYLGRSDLTAERFVPDAFAGDTGARLYRTGDRARWLADGTLEFLGRTDNQVKIRGFRIEPGEIEAVLAQAPGVVEAIVVAREDEPGDRRLVGYVTAAESGPPVSGGELRAFLKERLPDHMVPAEILVLETFPLTATGKIDRRALPAPEQPLGEIAEELGLHRTPTEEVVAGIWADVLRLPRVGAHRSFFELGGHSLLATQVVSRIRATFRVDVPVRALFEAPTVAELAERVDAAVRTGQGMEVPPLARAPRDGELPLSFAQERLWVIDRLDPGSSAYNMPFSLRLRGELDVDALRATLDVLVERHEALRTVFPATAGRPVQAILPASSVAVRVETLDGVAAEEREAAALRLAAEEAGRPFDLAGGPLFRATLLRIAEDDHLLVLAQHHIVSDGWSMGVVFRELSAVYGALVRGEPSPLSELPVQYADFALWQRGWLEGEMLERQVAYWRERLAGAPSLIDLPTDRPRRGVQTTRGARHPFRISRATLEGLAALGRREGATLFMTTLAAFQLLLAKYSGQPDVVIGTPIAGRNRQELEALIGFFVNTLALRTDLDGDPSFGELLGRVRESTLGAYAHQDLPFEKLVDEIQPVRDVTHAPVFQVMFTLQNLPARPLQLPGLTLAVVETENRTTKFDLSLSVAEAAEGLFGGFEYNADLFDAATIERMAERFAVLLERVVERPEARISTLSPLGDAERGQLLVEWNRTARDYPRALVHEQVAANARTSPDAAAIHFGAATVTYAELDRRANRIANHLRRLGVGPDVRVGISADRGPAMVAAVLGVFRAGGAYLPLDPSYPADRLAYMLEDARVPVLLTESALAGRLPATAAQVVLLDDAGDTIDAEPDTAPEVEVSPDNLAYVIYTSGSTGKPKGVMVSHANVANLVQAGIEAHGMTAGDVTVSLSSFAFDVWVFEVLMPLVRGGATRPVPFAHVLEIEKLVEEVSHATTVFTVPALARQVARRLAETGRTLPRLRRVMCGGDVVPPELLREMRAAFPSATLSIMYGPTEGTVADSEFVVPAEPPERNMIGHPLGNVTLYVCDRAGEPVPQGIAGELWIGGAGVARGYLGRPELTAAQFVPDAFGGEPGARLYRTGDRVRWLPDGELEFLGRMDHQVKIRGFRIEPGEIEALLATHPEVRDVIVLVREDAAFGVTGDRRLVAYVESAAGDALAGELREHVRGSLPEYMVPAAFVVMESFPLTPTGKTDRRALPAPGAASPGDEDQAPGTEMERTVARVWEEVLGIREVGTRRSFFDVGGNSLLLVQVASGLEAALGRPVPVIDLFQHTTVAALARHLAGAAAPEPAPVQTEERTEQLARGKGRLGQLLKRKQKPDR